MTHYITKDGLAELEQELKQIVDVQMPQALESLNRAREEGDLSENAAFDASKQEIELLSSRRGEIEDILQDYEIITKGKKGSKTSKVSIGSTVKVLFAHTNESKEVSIVGSSESDALAGKISNESPLAVAIIGKKAGDSASVKTKSSKIEVKVLEIIA